MKCHAISCCLSMWMVCQRRLFNGSWQYETRRERWRLSLDSKHRVGGAIVVIMRVHSRRSRGCSGSVYTPRNPPREHSLRNTPREPIPGAPLGNTLGNIPRNTHPAEHLKRWFCVPRSVPRGGFHLEPLPEHPLERLL
jgi:hypothetical protein